MGENDKVGLSSAATYKVNIREQDIHRELIHDQKLKLHVTPWGAVDIHSQKEICANLQPHSLVRGD